MWVRLSFLICFSIVTHTKISFAIDPCVQTYVHESIQTIQNSVNQNQDFNWVKAKAQILIKADHAVNPSDVYPIFEDVLKHFGLKCCVISSSIKSKMFHRFSQFQAHVIAKYFIYLKIPNISIQNRAFDQNNQRLQKMIRRSASRKPLGWIIDLRDNNHQDLHHLMTMLSFFYDHQNPGRLEMLNGHCQPLTKTSSNLLPDSFNQVSDQTGRTISVNSSPFIALLVGANTSPAVHNLALSFQGQKNVCIFYQSCNQLSSNYYQFIHLKDGAIFQVHSGYMQDRTYNSDFDPKFIQKLSRNVSQKTDSLVDDVELNDALDWMAGQIDQHPDIIPQDIFKEP